MPGKAPIILVLKKRKEALTYVSYLIFNIREYMQGKARLHWRVSRTIILFIDELFKSELSSTIADQLRSATNSNCALS